MKFYPVWRQLEAPDENTLRVYGSVIKDKFSYSNAGRNLPVEGLEDGDYVMDVPFVKKTVFCQRQETINRKTGHGLLG